MVQEWAEWITKPSRKIATRPPIRGGVEEPRYVQRGWFTPVSLLFLCAGIAENQVAANSARVLEITRSRGPGLPDFRILAVSRRPRALTRRRPSPVTSKPASRGRIKTGHSEVVYSYRFS